MTSCCQGEPQNWLWDTPERGEPKSSRSHCFMMTKLCFIWHPKQAIQHQLLIWWATLELVSWIKRRGSFPSQTIHLLTSASWVFEPIYRSSAIDFAHQPYSCWSWKVMQAEQIIHQDICRVGCCLATVQPFQAMTHFDWWHPSKATKATCQWQGKGSPTCLTLKKIAHSCVCL